MSKRVCLSVAGPPTRDLYGYFRAEPKKGLFVPSSFQGQRRHPTERAGRAAGERGWLALVHRDVGGRPTDLGPSRGAVRRAQARAAPLAMAAAAAAARGALLRALRAPRCNRGARGLIAGVIYTSDALMLRPPEGTPAEVERAHGGGCVARGGSEDGGLPVGSFAQAEAELAATLEANKVDGPTWMDVLHPLEDGPDGGRDGVVMAPNAFSNGGAHRQTPSSVAGAPSLPAADESAAVRGKYAARLQQIKMRAAAGKSTGIAPRASAGTAESGGTPASWNASPGAKVALAHLRERRLKQGLLSFAAAQEHFPSAQLLSQLGGFAFDSHITELPDDPSLASDVITSVCARWGKEPKSILVVGRDAQQGGKGGAGSAGGVLFAARQAGCLTVRVGPSAAPTSARSAAKSGWMSALSPFGQVPKQQPFRPDYNIAVAADVTTVVEYFNGVSLRASTHVDAYGMMAPEAVSGVGAYGVAST